MMHPRFRSRPRLVTLQGFVHALAGVTQGSEWFRHPSCGPALPHELHCVKWSTPPPRKPNEVLKPRPWGVYSWLKKP